MTISAVAVGVSEGQDPNVLRFAFAEAARLGRALRVIHVVENPVRASAVVQDLGHDFDALMAAVPFERVTIVGDAAAVLLAEAATASLLVLGAGDPALSPAHRSEVAQHVALHATAPVVVVPADSAHDSDLQSVLVTVDDARPAGGQLAYAVEAAELRDSRLEVVFGAGTTSDYPERVQHLSRLEDLVDRWRTSHPSVSIHVAVEGGHPVESCLNAGSRASLIVVGRPAGKHPRLGSRSVASRILRGAQVPVAIVPLDYVAAGDLSDLYPGKTVEERFIGSIR